MGQRQLQADWHQRQRHPAQMGAATPQTGVGGVDLAGLIQDNYNTKMANYQSGMNAMGGIFGLGAKAFMGGL